jgi:mannose-1-phosphate guanylyltransferase
MADLRTYALILAGGSGTRFWPASRRARPKQFLAIAGERPMIAETRARLAGLVPDERVLVVTSGEQAPLVREALPELPPENVLTEPCARNTAACIALAAFEVERRDPDSVQLVLPADHVIRPPERFRATLSAAAAEARRSHRLMTLGIQPTYPATGYGYIELGERLGEADGLPVHAVARFVEKPELERAREFLGSGRFRWNAGIFVWETAAILEAFAQHAPEIHGALRGRPAAEELARLYPTLPALPVDRAIMERAENRGVIPIDFAWSDVGSWPSLAEVLELDAEGNCASGGARLLAEDSAGCVVYGEGGAVALIGVQDLVVVHAGGATLVCPKDRAQDVRRIVERLEEEGPELL